MADQPKPPKEKLATPPDAAAPHPASDPAGDLRVGSAEPRGDRLAAARLWPKVALPADPAAGAGPAERAPGELPRRFPDTASALSALLQRARTMGEAGVPARLPVQSYLDALGSVLHFIAAHPLLHGEVNLSAEMCGAVLRVAEELQGRVPSAPGLAEPLAVLPPLSVQHEEAIRTGVLLLGAYRQAVRKALRGPKAAAARAEFAVDSEVNTRDGEQVAAGITRFLHAAERFPEVLAEAGLTGPQMLGLAAQERVLRALAEQRRSEAVAAGSAYRTRVLHLALESFFDRYCAALLLRMLAEPEAQLRGLALAPRATAPRHSGRRLTDYAACRVTDSGRLVF